MMSRLAPSSAAEAVAPAHVMKMSQILHKLSR